MGCPVSPAGYIIFYSIQSEPVVGDQMKILGLMCLAILLFGCTAQVQTTPTPTPLINELTKLPSHVPAHLTNCSYAGTWNSDYGMLNITQTGSIVTGTESLYPDTFNGTVIDGVFIGKWIGPNATGDEILYFENNCSSFSGVWSYGVHNSYGTAWDGTWSANITSAPQPTQAATHLTNCSYNGSWSGDWGVINFTQTGSSVTGVYEHDVGRFSGTVTDGVLAGTWSEAPSYAAPNDAGDAILYFANNCNEFGGTWGYGTHQSGSAWEGIWTGARN